MKRLFGSGYVPVLLSGAFALGNCAIGLSTRSWWFVTLGAYYLVLTVAHFSIVRIRRRAAGDRELERFAARLIGILLVVLSLCFAGIVILAVINRQGTVHHEILMIAIAAYTFTRIVTAIIGLIKAKKAASPAVKTLRNLSLADAAVAVYTLQRSMLVSFPGMAARDIQLFNILTGTAVWLLVLLLGVNLIGGRGVTMAKSKLVQANEKIAETVVDGYKKIEKGVVDGYHKIEQGVVQGYTKVEDKFVEAYLTNEGETVAEAKERLKKK